MVEVELLRVVRVEDGPVLVEIRLSLLCHAQHPCFLKLPDVNAPLLHPLAEPLKAVDYGLAIPSLLHLPDHPRPLLLLPLLCVSDTRLLLLLLVGVKLELLLELLLEGDGHLLPLERGQHQDVIGLLLTLDDDGLEVLVGVKDLEGVLSDSREG